MHRSRLSLQRAGALALAVGALHLLLIGGVAERLAAVGAPQADRGSARSLVVVRATRPARDGARVDRAQSAMPPVATAVVAPSEAPSRVEQPPTPVAPRPARARSNPAAQHALRPVVPLAPDETSGAVRTDAPAATPSIELAAPETGIGARALPAYATAVPAPFAFVYTLTRGTAAARAELRWRIDGGRYDAVLEARDGDRTLVAWHSTGGFDDAGVAPQRFVDTRHGRAALAANFRRETGTVSFSGPPIEHALARGMQDRLSWMLQLAAIAAADPARVAADGVAMVVVGVRGDADVWRFEPLGAETLEADGAALPALRLLRRPERPYDTRAEVWLSPAHHYLPLRVVLSNGGARTQLQWRAAAPTP